MRVYIKDLSGEISAADVDTDGTVLAASSSLYHGDVTPENLECCDVDPDNADWYNSNTERWFVMDESQYTPAYGN